MTAFVSCKDKGETARSKPLIVNPENAQYADAAPTTQPEDLEADGMTGGVFAKMSMKEARELGYSFPPAPPTRIAKKADAPNENLSDYDTISVETLNTNCIACHTNYNAGGSIGDPATMHASAGTMACVDCHGGKWDVPVSPGLTKGDPTFERLKNISHVLPNPKTAALWMVGSRLSSGNPEIPGALTLSESPDYIRFINPGDLLSARMACFNCHADVVTKTETSMMAHGGMLWGAALYNNGAINRKNPIFGESYSTDGTPRVLRPESDPAVAEKTKLPGPPTADDTMKRGILPFLYPLPRWEVSQPGNILRVFERGGRLLKGIEVGNPNILIDIDPGRPDTKLSIRGFGTSVRTDPVFIGLQKTRLLDPTLTLVGTNDHPGDFRASGCSACHVVYANDRSPVHSDRWATHGNMGQSATKDPQIPKDESGHPISHQFVRSMPTSTCITCHIHPGTLVMNSYLGFTWWDNETDAEAMYPKKQKYLTGDAEYAVNKHNPEQAAGRGLWSNQYPNDENQLGMKAGENFLERVYTDINPQLKHTQFADFHGHGWVFRAVFKQDRHGNLLDHKNAKIDQIDAVKLKAGVDFQSTKEQPVQPDGTPVHLKDIHLEKGMHCVDCHFLTDMHGDGNLYGESRAAVAEECIDCHGSQREPAAIFQYLTEKDAGKKGDLLKRVFSGNAASTMSDGTKKNIIGRHFQAKGGKLLQKRSVGEGDPWEVRQTADDRVDRAKWNDSSEDSVRARSALYAHSVRANGKWGAVPSYEDVSKDGGDKLAHDPENFSCYACHTSWNTSCFGCHLPMRANWRKEMLHNEATFSRNYTNYNFQTLRDDVYMLGIDGSVKGNKIVPIRSACAVMVSSQDSNRNWLYLQQQTVSAEGYAGTAFSPYFPHTVRTVETKKCTDCHVSKENDNNAVMAQLLLQGTNAVNFMGRYAWVAAEHGGLNAVVVAEREEPQAVIGSRLHEIAYPDWYKQHMARGQKLAVMHDHHGDVLDVQVRGEYAYAACGKDGVIIYDIANIDNKGFSERIITAPVSPLGQRFYVKTKYATSIISPSTMAIDPTRPRLPENQEGRIVTYELGKKGKLEAKVVEESRPHHLMFAFLYATDKYEGLVVIGNKLTEKKNRPGVATLLDGDPDNNFIEKALSFNPSGALNDALSMTFYGHYGFICTSSGLKLVNLDNPLEPKLIDTPGLAGLKNPKKVQFQFRYGFVVDDEGLKVIDVTDVENPKLVAGALVPYGEARDVYLSRTFAYVAAGAEGLGIVDIEKPEQPKEYMKFTDGGLNDAHAVRIAMTNNSIYAYVADGRNGLKVLQLTDSSLNHATPGFNGFSPRPFPRLISWIKTHGKAVSLSEGLDRDRAVDESGHQLSVFGRRGARPFDLAEQQRLYLKADADGNKTVYTVTDSPEAEPLAGAKKPEEEKKPAAGPRPPGPRRPGQPK